MPLPTEDDYKSADKSLDHAIANLFDATRPGIDDKKEGGFSRRVYELVWKLVETGNAVKAVYNYKITDIEEYKAEIERRCQIGLTIDPAVAETMFWWADVGDSYHILDEKYHYGCIGREQFARHPGASNSDWVNFDELPEATREALWKRDGRKLSFPYGLNSEDDVINYPANAEGVKQPE
jgi:hypothetical protein